MLNTTVPPDSSLTDHSKICQQAGSSGNHCSESQFCGRNASSQLFWKKSQAIYQCNHAKALEDAFWQKIPLLGRKITSMDVLAVYQNDRNSLRAGLFLEKLCLYGIPCNGVKVAPCHVMEELNRLPDRNNKCQLAIAHFKEKCCLTGLLLNGRSITPDEVFNELLASPESIMSLAHFKRKCFLRNLPLNGRLVTPDEVINSFPKNPKGQLGIARFKAECHQRGLLNGHRITVDNDYEQGDGWHLEKSIFYAQKALNTKEPAVNYLNNDQRVSTEQILQATNNLGSSLTVPRLYFLIPVRHCLQALPGASRLHQPALPDTAIPLLSLLTNKVLEIIQEVNRVYPDQTILITGSFARYLQGVGSSFNDIDLICPAEAPVRILIDRLNALNTGADSDTRKRIMIWPVPGCPELRLPASYNINLAEADPGIKTMELQVSIDARVTTGKEGRVSVCLAGVKIPVSCLLFSAETLLMIDTLEYLGAKLDSLIDQLQKGPGFNIPRTILFNLPQTPEERVYGLLMRCLLTLDKARQFQCLLSEESNDYWRIEHSAILYRLQLLSGSLQAKLKRHTCCDHFVRRVEDWLATKHHCNGYEKKKCEFIQGLLAMVTRV